MTKRNKLTSVILTTMLSISIINTTVVSNQPVYAAAKTSQKKVTSVTKYRVKVKSTALKSKASSSGKTITNLKKGTDISVIGRKGSWSQVKYRGNTNCWVKTNTIQKVSTLKPKKRVVTANVVLYENPRSNSRITTTLRKGSIVFDLGKTSDSWVNVENGHYSGWVNKKYLR